MSTSKLITVVALVSLVSAQGGIGGLNLSSTCVNALESTATGPASTCLNIFGLIPLLSTPNNQSLIPPIDNWLTGLCKVDACPNATIASLTQNITTACQNDFAQNGVPASILTNLTTDIDTYYPVGREIVCLRDIYQNDTLCVTTVLTQIQTALGQPLSINGLISGIPTLLQDNNGTLATNITCSQCIQGAYSLLRPVLPADIVSSLDSSLNQECGGSFATNGEPSNIIVATGTNYPSATTSPMSAKSAGKTNMMTPSLVAAGSLVALVIGGVLVLIN